MRIYDKHPHMDAYRVGGSFTPYAIVATEKRFTDTELAAELFRQATWLGALKRTYATDEGRNVVIEAAFTFGPMTRDEHEWLTIRQFLARPHYDEGDQ